MSAGSPLQIALIGNPNSGKTSLFNHLTGLNQKVGNFPGVTVEKKIGGFRSGTTEMEVTDLPGIYSIYPRSIDERIVSEILLGHHQTHQPDLAVVVVDATNLKRGLLLATQVIDLGLPVILVLNMMDLVAQSGISYDLARLSQRLKVPVIPINARAGSGVEALKIAIAGGSNPVTNQIFQGWSETNSAVDLIQESLSVDNRYEAYLMLEQPHSLGFLTAEDQKVITGIRNQSGFVPGKFQGAETIQRYGFIQDLITEITLKPGNETLHNKSLAYDAILTHKIWGYLIFFGILFLIFQSIFAWATIPMDLIDSAFASLSSIIHHQLGSGPLVRLVADGIIPGIGGILIFVPQIAILFAFIAVLEETGYMARVVFLMDKVMRKFGLNGRSVVPLMSGIACAIPAIMATRTIDNWKERIITILVTPLMSCSARLPIFTILIALIIPDQMVLGFFNLQGLALMFLYLLGFIAAILSAWVMSKIIRLKERSYLIMELPTYRMPRWNNVGLTILEKTRSFVVEAGKVILAISIVLWVLASYGPGDNIEQAEERVAEQYKNARLTEQGFKDKVAAYKLEHSYAGILGKGLEPVIKPLGYDWKIGIALLTSFAAREVFVGTMATIYSIGSVDQDDEATIKNRMRDEINPETGEHRFTPAVGLSLLVFYTFAMQCMSTLAVVYRETKGWKWPVIQLIYMTALAYLSAFIVYQVLS